MSSRNLEEGSLLEAQTGSTGNKAR